MPLKDYLDEAIKPAMNAMGPSGMMLEGLYGGYKLLPKELQENLKATGMGALETINSPFEIAGETVRSAQNNEPYQMASASDPSGFRWPSIVQRLAPSTRTPYPPTDVFTKSFQGINALATFPEGLQAATDAATREPNLQDLLGGFSLGLGIEPEAAMKMAGFGKAKNLAKISKPLALESDAIIPSIVENLDLPAPRVPELPAPLMNEPKALALPAPKAAPQLPTAPVAPAGPWFSRLEQTLEKKMPPRASVEQVKNIAAEGLPKEEVDWRGLNEFLEQQHGPVSKEQVMGHLKQNPVEIGETKLAGNRSDYEVAQARRSRALVDESDLDFDEYPDEVTEKAQELQRSAADSASENFEPWDPGPGYGVEAIDRTEENLVRGSGQDDLWGKPISPLPDKYIVKYDGEPIMFDDLSQWHAKKAVPNEEGHAVFQDQSAADDAYYRAIEDDEMQFRDEQYEQWLRDNPPENFLEEAKAEVGYVYEDPDLIWASPDDARTAFNEGTHDIFDEGGYQIEDIADITDGEDFRMLPVEGTPIPRLPAGQAPPGAPPRPGAGPTKYENYSTPGGKNYREVLMTLPESRANVSESAVLEQAIVDAKGQGEQWENLGTTGQELFINAARKRFETTGGTFKSGHWQQPNVLAHIRMKDVADPTTGKKILLVDEIQSDWHQKGRQHGYKTGGKIEAHHYEPSDFKITQDEHSWYTTDFHGKRQAVGKGTVDGEEGAREYFNRWLNKLEQEETAKAHHIEADKVPNAPFKKNWQELAFKRALKEAVEGGYDEMAWTTGAQQADRYSLSKQVDKITYNPTTKDFSAFRGGSNVVDRANVEPKGLEELVGKDVADKLLAQKVLTAPSIITELPENYTFIHDSHGVPDQEWGIIRTDDPGASARSLTGRYHPSKEEAKTQMLNVLNDEQDYAVREHGLGAHVLEGLDLKTGGEGMKGFYDDILPAFANKYLRKYGVKAEKSLLASGPEAPMVHKIKITPEMKADILGKGQPMWQVPAAIGAGAAGAAATEAEAAEPSYAGGGIVEEESDMYKNKMNQGGVVGDWHDEMTNHLDQQYGEPQSMASGGVAGSPYDIDLGGTSTVRGLPVIPQTPLGTPIASPPPLTFNPRAGLPPTPPTPVAAAPVAPAPMAPSGPDPLQLYLAEQKQKLNRYGPDEQMELEQSLDKQRRGFLPNLALAGTGLADSIMQGVARAGSSNFQSNLENRMDRTQAGQRQAFESGRTGHMAKMKQEMELAQMDPTSPISRLAQRTAAPLLEEIGLTPEEIQNIPASLIGEVQTKGLTLEEIRSRADLAEAVQKNTAAYQGETLAAGRRKEEAEAADKTAERQYRAAKDIKATDVAPKAHVFGSDIPYWFSPVSRKQRRDYRNVIRGQAAGAPTVTTPGTSAPSTTQVNSRQEWEALAPGTPYTDSNGRYGVKK